LVGVIHLLNLSVDPVDEVIIQSIVVILPGIFYAVIVLLSRSLWPAIIIHWITNAVVNIQLAENTSQQISTFDWLQYAVLLIPLMVYSVVLIMKSDFSRLR
jgi:membrane protease YdiL (CAAX protease family)